MIELHAACLRFVAFEECLDLTLFCVFEKGILE